MARVLGIVFTHAAPIQSAAPNLPEAESTFLASHVEKIKNLKGSARPRTDEIDANAWERKDVGGEKQRAIYGFLRCRGAMGLAIGHPRSCYVAIWPSVFAILVGRWPSACEERSRQRFGKKDPADLQGRLQESKPKRSRRNLALIGSFAMKHRSTRAAVIRENP